MGNSKFPKILCNDNIVKRLEIWGLLSAIMYIAAQFIIYFIEAALFYKDYDFQPPTFLIAAAYDTVGAIQIVPYIFAAVVMLLIKKPSKLKLVGFLSLRAVWGLVGAQVTLIIAKTFLGSSWGSMSYVYHSSIEYEWVGRFITYFLSVASITSLMIAAAIDFFRADSGKVPNNSAKLWKIAAYIVAVTSVISILFMLLNFIISLHNTVMRSGKFPGVIVYVIMIASTSVMAVIVIYCVKNNGLCRNGKNLILVMFAAYLIRGASCFVSGIYSFLHASPFSAIANVMSSCFASVALFAVIIIGSYQIHLNDKGENL